MRRNGWGIASSIYSWISGVGDIGLGIFGLILSGTFQGFIQTLITGANTIGEFSSSMGDQAGAVSADAAAGGLEMVGAMAYLPLLIALLILLGGIGRCVIGYGLLVGHNWARIGGAIFHFLSVAGALLLAVMLIRIEFYGLSILPLLFFIGNIVLAVGLLLPATAAVYSGAGGTMSIRQTQIAGVDFGGPAYPPPMTFAPAPVAPVAATSAYAQPRPAGVARTEVAGPVGPQVIAWLVERNGPRPGKEHKLDNQITIGRDNGRCEIVLEDSKISGEHARIRFEQGRYILFDLASTNHTYVNNQEVQRHALQDGDQIRLGPNVQLTFMQAGKP